MRVLRKLKLKKRLLIVAAILLTIIGLGIVTLVCMKLLPLSMLLTFPLVLLTIYKLGKDVDAIIDLIFLAELSEEGGVFEGILDVYEDEEIKDN